MLEGQRSATQECYLTITSQIGSHALLRLIILAYLSGTRSRSRNCPNSFGELNSLLFALWELLRYCLRLVRIGSFQRVGMRRLSPTRQMYSLLECAVRRREQKNRSTDSA